MLEWSETTNILSSSFRLSMAKQTTKCNYCLRFVQSKRTAEEENSTEWHSDFCNYFLWGNEFFDLNDPECDLLACLRTFQRQMSIFTKTKKGDWQSRWMVKLVSIHHNRISTKAIFLPQKLVWWAKSSNDVMRGMQTFLPISLGKSQVHRRPHLRSAPQVGFLFLLIFYSSRAVSSHSQAYKLTRTKQKHSTYYEICEFYCCEICFFPRERLSSFEGVKRRASFDCRHSVDNEISADGICSHSSPPFPASPSEVVIVNKWFGMSFFLRDSIRRD